MNAREQDRQVARYQWLTVKQAAEALGNVSGMQVRRWIADGELAAFDASKKNSQRKEYRIAPEWIDAFLTKRTRNGEEAAA